MTTKTKIIVSLIVIALVVGGIFFLKSSQQAQTLKIGGVYGLTGAYAGAGEQYKNGILLAAKEINSQGGIDGKQVEIIIEDNKSDVKTAISALQKLVSIDKVRYYSAFGSSVALALKPISEEKKVLGFLDATHPQITENSTLVIRHSNIANVDASLIAETVIETNPKEVGAIYVNDSYGSIIDSELAKIFSNKKIQYSSKSHDPKETDFKSHIAKLLTNKPEAIIIASVGASNGLIVKQLRESGYKGKIFNNIGLILTPDAQKIAGDYLKGVYYQTYTDMPQDFAQRYKNEYGKDPGVFAWYPSFDLEVLKYAIEKVGDDPVKVANFIKEQKEFKGKYETAVINSNGDIIIPTVMKVWQ